MNMALSYKSKYPLDFGEKFKKLGCLKIQMEEASVFTQQVVVGLKVISTGVGTNLAVHLV